MQNIDDWKNSPCMQILLLFICSLVTFRFFYGTFTNVNHLEIFR